MFVEEVTLSVVRAVIGVVAGFAASITQMLCIPTRQIFQHRSCAGLASQHNSARVDEIMLVRTLLQLECPSFLFLVHQSR